MRGFHSSTRAMFTIAAGLATAAAVVGAYSLATQSQPSRADAILPDASAVAAELALTAPLVQRGALEDGKVTFAEYEAALEETARCLEERGAPINVAAIREPGAGTGGTTRLSWSSSDPATHPELQPQLIGCFDVHISGIGRVWELQNQPTPEEVAEMWASIDACLDEAGWGELEGLLLIDIVQRHGGDSPEAFAYRECAGPYVG